MTAKAAAQSSIELQLEYNENLSSSLDLVKTTLPQHIQIVNDTDTKADEDKQSTASTTAKNNNKRVDNADEFVLFYAKFDQFMTFLLIFCDFYIRSFSLIFPLFMIRYVTQIYLKTILSICTIIILFVVVLQSLQ